MHDPPIAPAGFGGEVVLNGVVHGDPVVPHRERAGGPVKAAAELGPRRMRRQVVQDRPTLLDRHVLQVLRVRIRVQRPATGTGVSDHHRVRRGAGIVALLVHALEVRGVGGGGGRYVHAPEVGEQRLHALGEGLVREIHVDEQRVAAMRGDLSCVERSPDRGLFEEGEVGVQVDAAPVGLLVALLDDLDDPGKSVDALHEGVRDELGEMRGKVGMLLRAEILVPEEHDEVLVKGFVDFGQGVVGDWPAQVDAVDLGAERAGNRLHIDASVVHAIAPGE